MKKVFIACIAAVIAWTALKCLNVDVEPDRPSPVVVEAAEPLLIKKIVKKPAPRSKDMRAFLRQMGKVESNNDHTVVNRHGMMGRYQFHPGTIKAVGFNVTRDEFLNNPALQDSVMIAYLRANRRELRKVIAEFVGTTVRGVHVTESGILAGAHLGGTVGVLAFFYPEKYVRRTVDSNGTSIAYYMTRFAGYKLF